MFVALFILLISKMVIADSVPGQEDQCGGPLSTFEWDDVLDAYAYFARCTQPTYKLNVDCILDSCSCLRKVCPINSNGSFDTNALTSAVFILNRCIRQDRLICGINFTHTPMVQLSWTTKELLPSNVVNGTMHLKPGTGFLDNLSCARFTVVRTDDPQGTVTLDIQAPNITNEGHFNATFNMTDNSFLRSLTRRLTTTDVPNSLNTPNLYAIYRNPISSVVSIDLCASPPAIRILDDHSDIDIVFSNFASANGLALPQCLVGLFNQGMQNYIKNSVITTAAINFLATYVALGLQAAQINCP